MKDNFKQGYGILLSILVIMLISSGQKGNPNNSQHIRIDKIIADIENYKAALKEPGANNNTYQRT